MSTIRHARWLLVIAIVALLVAACSSDDGGGDDDTTQATDAAQPEEPEPEADGAADGAADEDAPEGEPAAAPTSYERTETLFTGGKQWGPPDNWNPIWPEYVTGTLGLVYETLFLYDPLIDEFIPWLAESDEWVSDEVYEITLREGVTWHDGEALTSADVVTTFELVEYPSTRFSGVWASGGGSLVGVEAVDDLTVRFTFEDPLYQQWGERLYDVAIVPQHIWGDWTEEEVAAGANENPVGTGAYMYDTHDQTRQVWVKNPDWWGEEHLGRQMAAERIVDVVNSSNNVALGSVVAGELDINNNFLPGVAQLVDEGYVKTYHPGPPYMLSANTAWLTLNTERPPMDDPAFRRALAYAINVEQIVNGVYGRIVEPANPTGLLPIWNQYIDQDVVDELGFGYDPAEAEALLTDAGYVDSNGDGFVEMPDGSPIELELIVPNGWTDWMESIRVVAESAGEVGINIRPEFPEFAALVDARNGGDFDLVIANDRQISSTPWTYFDFVFGLPIEQEQVATNRGRYVNDDAWALVQEFDRTPKDDLETLQALASEIQRVQLEEMPIIPLWYNGLWSQTNDSVWTNWPSADSDNNYLPTTWNNFWNMTGVLMLTELELTPTDD